MFRIQKKNWFQSAYVHVYVRSYIYQSHVGYGVTEDVRQVSYHAALYVTQMIKERQHIDRGVVRINEHYILNVKIFLFI